MDRVHGVVDRQCGRVHGGLSGGTDNCAMVCRRHNARRALWASEAHRRGPGRKRAMRRSHRGQL
jgi:hypothetical protein